MREHLASDTTDAAQKTYSIQWRDVTSPGAPAILAMDSICAGSMLAIMSVICLIIAGSCMMFCICAGSIPGGIPMGDAGMLGAVRLPPACCGAIVVAAIFSTLSESASDTWPSSTVLLVPGWLLLLAVPLPLSDGRSVWELAGTAAAAAV